MSRHPDIFVHPPTELPTSYFEIDNWSRVRVEVRGRTYTGRVVSDKLENRHDEYFLVYRELPGGGATLYRHLVAKPVTPHGRGVFEDPPSEIPRSEIGSYGFFPFRVDGSSLDHFIGEGKVRHRKFVVVYRERIRDHQIFHLANHYRIHDLTV